MAAMEFEVDLKRAEECVAFVRALNDGVEAFNGGDHAKARACFDAADRARAAFGKRRAGASGIRVTIGLDGALLAADPRELGESLARAMRDGAPAVDAAAIRR